MTLHTVQSLFEARRSLYVLGKDLPISQADIVQAVEHALMHTPSAMNSQSTRIVVLFGKDHDRLWQIVETELRKVVPAENFQPTAERLALFGGGAGTILFFEDNAVVKGLQEKLPTYAANFPLWAEQTNAMHQYAIWTALRAADIGANIQHYSPLIDAAVAQAWQIPADWQLKAQMVFGNILAPAKEKTHQPIEARLKVFGVE
ncbi:nitroreductase family protein [Mannheimia indoligenes]|uniref:nitroreductase family protein n=1 Tax=Mannheimia indoligenes TaxID=3103145 RepID=UPI002FE6A87A